MLTCPLSGKAQDIRMRICSGENAPFQLNLLGADLSIIPSENCLKCKDSSMPLFLNGQEIVLRIITDTNAIEIYADEGEAFLCAGHTADYNLNRIILSAGESKLFIKEIRIAGLVNIWDNTEK